MNNTCAPGTKWEQGRNMYVENAGEQKRIDETHTPRVALVPGGGTDGRAAVTCRRCCCPLTCRCGTPIPALAGAGLVPVSLSVCMWPSSYRGTSHTGEDGFRRTGCDGKHCNLLHRGPAWKSRCSAFWVKPGLLLVSGREANFPPQPRFLQV